MTLSEVGECDWGHLLCRLLHSPFRPFIEARLSETTVKGLPVVSDDDNRTMMGYVGRMELRYVIGTLRPLTMFLVATHN